jgi:hypothetical protein
VSRFFFFGSSGHSEGEARGNDFSKAPFSRLGRRALRPRLPLARESAPRRAPVRARIATPREPRPRTRPSTD